ncbi:amidase signature domain-containing protein [Chlamydoabsidia padenii]|nr:amidase signature domain-containing protein [Chlamydoabsidia padenii]
MEQYDKYNWIRSYNANDILQQAEESTQRYENGNPKSQLDGVFIPIKEEFDVAGLETKCGTSFINDGKPAGAHAILVQRLHDAGAIIVGQTVMDELGWDTFTVNPTTGMPRNPHETSSSCGGSSGGSGGVVGANLFPIAIGNDGGGSIRIPATFCGVYGLKTTAGRVSITGTSSIESTVAASGPIGATADDMTLAYAIMSGVDDKDPLTLIQPRVSLRDYTLTHSLAGVKIGIMPQWNECAEEPAMLRQLDVFAKFFESIGATMVEIDIPDLDLAKTAHLITICSETYGVTLPYPKQRSSFSPYTRLMSAVTSCLSGNDYCLSQQVRGKMMDHLQRLFTDKVDLILTPATGMQTPVIPTGALRYGISNAAWTTKTMEFTTLANFTGIPAVSIPSGFHNGKPLGIQLMAEWFNEALLCRMAKVCELAPGIERKRPTLWCDALNPSE